MIQLRDYQSDMVARVKAGMRQSKWQLLQLATGGGKCLGKNTPVLMYDGTIKMVQDVVIGDLLMGPDSNPRLVDSLSHGKEMLYKITPTKGDPWVCNESHILSLKRTGGSKSSGAIGYESRSRPKGMVENISVLDYIKKSKTFKHIAKQWRTGVEFNSGYIPEIDPYFLGIWLGDGGERQPVIHTLDNEISDCVFEVASDFGLSVRVQKDDGKCPAYFITSGSKGGRSDRNHLLDEMRNIGVINNKHIPNGYKTASRNVRLELLAGLIDSDGHVHHNGCDIVQKRKVLAQDIAFLCRSLGLAAYISECEKTCVNNGAKGKYYRVSISGDMESVPTRVPRKKFSKRLQKKDVLVTGFSIEPVGVGDYYGFSIVGPDRLFLLGDFTVTHNTFTAGHMIDSARKKGNTCFFVVPRRELLKQTAESYASVGIPFSYVAAGYSYNPYSKVQLCTVGSLAKRLDRVKPPRLAFIDETHYGSNQLGQIIQWLKDHGSYGIGLSATPSRTDGRGLGMWYDSMVEGPTPGELIRRGELSDYRLFGVDAPDMSGIRTVAGDYAKGQLADKMEQDRVLVGSAVSHYRNHAMGRLNVTFCASVKHAEIVAASFRDGGVPAACIHGGQDDGERARLIKAFARRELLVLTSCQLLTFGFDLSSAAQMDVTVECMSDLQPTQSLAMQLQKWGRSLRKKDYPALLFDHAGNAGRHGFPDDERDWTLADREKRKGGNSEPTLPVRQCHECYFCHRPAPECPECGFVYPVQDRVIEEVEGELQELARERERKAERQAQGMAKTYPELVAHFIMRGSRNPHFQAKKVLEARGQKSA